MRNNLLRSYQSDASRLKGKIKGVIHPKSINEIKTAVLKNPKITIRGAGTGLAGGAVPQGDVVLDLSKLKGVGKFDEKKKTIEAEAGVILDDLQDFLKKFGLEFPVKPSSHEVATIGGMIATNAIGNRGVKYGKTSNWVRWVDIIDSAGRLERKTITEMSDYVGMEGISGIIVRACLKLNNIRERSASIIRLKNLEEVEDVVRKLKRRQNVSMIEFLDKIVSKGVGFGEGYHLIVEYEGDEGSLKGSEYRKIIGMRDEVYPFVAGEGYTRIEDPKIMINKFPKLMRWLEARSIPIFGHIGVGILHPCFNTNQEKLIPDMIKLVKRLGGQVSGEHGIGILKRKFVEINDQKIIRNIKKRTDPLNKFNTGKII